MSDTSDLAAADTFHSEDASAGSALDETPPDLCALARRLAERLKRLPWDRDSLEQTIWLKLQSAWGTPLPSPPEEPDEPNLFSHL